MSLLTRDQILTADDLPFEDVPVPEWGGTVRVRTMTGAERDAYEIKMSDHQADRTNIRAGLAAQVVVGEDGAAVFTKGDIAKLGRKSAKALDRVFDVAARLSGISDDAAEQKQREADLDEDFDNGPDGHSITG